MLAASVRTVSSHFRKNLNFFLKTKMLLTSNDLTILNQAFLCSINENPKTVTVSGKKSFSREAYYRQYLLNSPKYSHLIFRGGVQTNSKTVALLNQLDEDTDNKPNLKNELSDQLDRELNQFSFSELCEVVFLVINFVTQNDNDPIWKKILGSINKECLARMPDWAPDELLKMLYVTIMLQQPLKFKRKLMFKSIYKCSTSQQVVFLFYVMFKRKFLVPKDDLFNLEKKIMSIFPEINSIEAGIIAEGCICCFKNFKNNDVFCDILNKGFDVETVDKIQFSSFCKFARVMSNKTNLEEITEFQKNSIETALRFGVEEVILLGLTGKKVRYLDSNLQSVLMKEVKHHIRQISAQYIERVTYITTLFNIHDEEFLKQAVEVFEKEEITDDKSRKNCVLFLSYLTNFKVYPKSLINIVFEEEFVEKLIDYGKRYVYALWLIYCALKLEKPEYLTFDLAPEIRKKIYRQSRVKFFTSAKNHSKLWQVETVLTQLYGEGTVKYLMPLPLYPIGILMKFDKNSNPQKLPEEFKSLTKNFEVKPLKDDHIWLFIICTDHSVQTDISSNVPSLAFQTQVRQLNAFGYTTLPVNLNFLFKNISVQNQDILEYFKSLISNKLEECYQDQKGVVIN